MKDLSIINEGILNWLQESAEIGIFTTDKGLNIKTWNKWLNTHSLLRESEVIGKNLFEVCPDLISHKLDSYYQQAIQGHSIPLFNLFHNYIIASECNDLDMTYIQHCLQISPLKINEQIIGTITVILQVGKKAFEKEKLVGIDGKEEWESIFDSLPDLIAVIDASHRIKRINKTMADSLGIKIEDALGRHCYEIVHGTDAPPIYCPHSKLLKDTDTHSEDLYVESLGGHFNVIVTPLFDRDGTLLGSLHIAHDISERIKAEQLLKNLSLIDDLTGILNRRGFITATEQLIKMADRFSSKMLLLFIDLNDMKYINDTFGHLEGDSAIRDTANILKDTFRESDVIARYGGDEFIVSTLQTGYIKPDTIKERLNKNIDLYNNQSNKKYKISLSIGISVYDPEAPVSLDDLIFDADNLMYKYKYSLKLKKD